MAELIVQVLGGLNLPSMQSDPIPKWHRAPKATPRRRWPHCARDNWPKYNWLRGLRVIFLRNNLKKKKKRKEPSLDSVLVCILVRKHDSLMAPKFYQALDSLSASVLQVPHM
jgi:hypothetical protein